MNRRTFIQTAAASGVVASLPLRAFAAEHQIKEVGLQLYTVRDSMKADFAGTLSRVAAVGYKEAEMAGYFGHAPKVVRAELDKNGLTSPSAHFPLEDFEKHLPETIEGAHIVGHKFLVCPWIDESLRKQEDGYKRVAESFNKAGEACKKADIQFAYHNHVFEFVPTPGLGGKLPYEFLLEQTSPDYVKMEMDLCWITTAGQDPISYFQKYPGRFPLVHVKDIKIIPHPKPSDVASIDMESVVKTNVTEAGSGAIDWKNIFSHSEEAGIKHYFVEHDSPAHPFASIKTSYTYLAALRF